MDYIGMKSARRPQGMTIGKRWNRQWTMVLLTLLVVLIFVGCSDEETPVETELEVQASKPVVSRFFDALWIDGETIDYHPMYATKTKREIKEPQHLLPFNMNGLTFDAGGLQPEIISYTLYDDEGDTVEIGMVDQLTRNNENLGYLFQIHFNGLFEENEEFLLEIAVSMDGDKAFYYTGLQFNSGANNELQISDMYGKLKSMLKKEETSISGEPLIWFDEAVDNMHIFDVSFTGAKRLDQGFDYCRYDMRLGNNVSAESLDMTIGTKRNKQRFYYNSDAGWIMGTQETIGENDEVANDANHKLQLKSVSNDSYELIYNNEEMVIFDKEESYLHKILHLETFDSDYVYDEYADHEISVLDLKDDGSVHFIIYGYQNNLETEEHYDINQKYGVGFYRYEDGLVIRLSFVEDGREVNVMRSYYEAMTFYNREMGTLFFWDKQSLYALNFEEEEFSHEGYFLKGEFQQEDGIIAWQGSDEKYNASVFVASLDSETFEVKNFYRTGENRHLLSIKNGQVIVGVYDMANTFETLDQTVEYRYHRLDVYDRHGHWMESIESGDESYFGDVYEEDGQVLVDRLKMKSRGEEKSFRLYYEVIDTIELDNGTEPGSDDAQYTDDSVFVETYPDGVIEGNEEKLEGKDMIYLHKSPYINSGQKITFGYEPVDIYEISADGLILYADQFQSALKKAKNYKQVKITYIDKRENDTTRTLLFDSNWKQSEAYLEEVLVIPQRPELPRGCEVTSLSILLNFYMEAAPDKMELAAGLEASADDYEVINGIIHFSDMHYEFAGSMEDVNEPGLGVYVKPVKDLSEVYVSGNTVTYGSFDVTGMSFEQMLTFVSNDTPVLIIIPNRYKAVPDYAIEVWKTPSGFMEVTYQEHSVVLMGFDDNYAYYSDPSREIIDKKPIGEFQQAWESIGSQGMIILE